MSSRKKMVLKINERLNEKSPQAYALGCVYAFLEGCEEERKPGRRGILAKRYIDNPWHYISLSMIMLKPTENEARLLAQLLGYVDPDKAKAINTLTGQDGGNFYMGYYHQMSAQSC